MTVPLPTNIVAEDILDIMKEAECAALMVSVQEAPALANVIGGVTSLRSVIVMGR